MRSNVLRLLAVLYALPGSQVQPFVNLAWVLVPARFNAFHAKGRVKKASSSAPSVMVKALESARTATARDKSEPGQQGITTLK